MCGICGALNVGGTAVDEQQIVAMTSTLRHRGPDDMGVATNGRILFGHVRLSIIDLAGGAQPMQTHDGRFWITYNGEIFNFVELRTELETLGHTFLTSSDTEVILEAYREWGTDCFARFNGQWALGLYDQREGLVILSRDRAGIRPLYYTVLGRSVLFASEVKALFAHPGVGRRIDPDGLAEVLTFWSPVAPETVFEGIRQLAPGHVAVVQSRTGDMEIRPYWQPVFSGLSQNGDATIEDDAEALRDELVKATKLRFDRSDVPVGAYLSGGIDSTVSVAIIARHTSAPLKTFSVAFSSDEFDESEYQHLVAAELGTEHESIVVEPRDIGRIFPDVVWHGEQPLLRTAPAPLFLLSGLVRESGYKVVVTGEGSDEVLAGYDVFREAMVRRSLSGNSTPEERREAVQRLYPWMQRSPSQAPAFAEAFFGQGADLDDPALSHRPRWSGGTALVRFLRPELRSQIDVAQRYVDNLPASFSGWAPLEQAQFIEMTTLLPGYILSAQGDRMLMGHSVEGRFPFLDHNVMELASRMNPSHKLHDFVEKRVLKTAFADVVPAAVRDRPKQPYRAPDASSFVDPDGTPDWLPELLSERSLNEAGLFDATMVSRLMQKCRSVAGRSMNNTDNMRMVAVVSTMLLHDQFIRNQTSRGGVPRSDEVRILRMSA